MPLLHIHRKQHFKLSIPYWIFLNDQPVGIMRHKDVSLQLPPGQYKLSVKIVLGLFKWRLQIGGSNVVSLQEGEQRHVRVTDRERWWNLLFDLDLVIWIACMFIELPEPWNVVYHVLSEGFFALWLLRILIIRKRYFKLKTSY